MKRAFKYLIILIANLIILTVLLAIWTDSFELTYNDWVRPIEFLKIIGFTIVSLIGIRILVGFLRKRKIQSIKQRIKIASILTLIICSYLYFDYSIKIIKNQFINKKIRQGVMSKVQPSKMLANGTKAENLTITEYELITKINWFPALPSSAYNIGYAFSYDGFLPDYIFTLTYDLPLGTKISEINYIDGDFTKTQTMTILKDRIRVTYEEYVQ